MSDRPWDAAGAVKAEIKRSDGLADPVDKASDVDGVTVDFSIPTREPWEESSRYIRSGISLDPDGVWEISARLPEAVLEMSSFQARKLLSASMDDAIIFSSFPNQASVRVRGGSEGWNPHGVWGGRPDTRNYSYEDGDQHRLDPRNAVRVTDNLVSTYRDEVRANAPR